MVKSIIFCTLIAGLLILAGVQGCSKPESNPVQPPPVFQETQPLDLSLNYIPRGDKPWLISRQDWVIDSGRTVEIEPGTVIMFDSLNWIDVQGQLKANGTAAAPIVFTSAYLEPEMGQWRGIKLTNETIASEFRHCIFSYGAFYDTDTTNYDARTFKGMLAISNSSPIIERCIAIFNQNNAVYITGPNSHPRVRYNIFTRNDASGVRADTNVALLEIDVSYNCVGENSALPMLMGFDTTLFTVPVRTNANLDSCDIFFNIDMDPLLTDPVNGDFSLQSCSPAIDSGPEDLTDPDPDGTRADMGVTHYVQTTGELRGVVEGTLTAGNTYRMSCNVRVDSGKTLTIPAGTRVEITGLYELQVYGRLVVEGTTESRVHLMPSAGAATDIWGGLVFLNLDTLSAPSVIRGAEVTDYARFFIERPGVVVENCRLERGLNYGLVAATGTVDPAQAVQVSGCTVRETGMFGVRIFECSASIYNTLVENVAGRGIDLDSTFNSVNVSNCIIRDCGTSGMYMLDFCSPNVVNCVFLDNGYHGIHMDNNCQPVLRNNIVCTNARYGIYAQHSSLPVLLYNNVYGHVMNGSATDYVPASLQPADGGNTMVEPLFVSADDPHLAPGSPMIDAGDPDPAYNDTDGSRNDMGAFGGPGGYGVGASGLRSGAGRLASR